MTHLRPKAFLAAAAVALGGGPLAAQSAGPAAQAPDGGPQTPPALAAPAKPKPPAAPKGEEDRQITSADIAGALADSLPKFQPQKAEPPPDPQAAVQPKNGIVRLPDYTVRQAKLPTLTERDVLSDKGLLDLAEKRYLSDLDRGILNYLPRLPYFSGLAADRALFMYQEDERLRKMADLNDTADAMIRGGDTAEGEYIKRESQDTFMRPDAWVDQPAVLDELASPGLDGHY